MGIVPNTGFFDAKVNILYTKYKFIEVLRPWGVAPIPHQFLKKLDKNFYQNAISLRFSEKIISFVIKIYFFKNFAKKISFALILNRKSCICCHKHCRAYFRRHMECAVLKRFLKVQGTFAIKKFLANPTFPFGKN